MLHTSQSSEILGLGLVSNHGMVLVAVQSQTPHWMQVGMATAAAIMAALVLARVISVVMAFFRFYGFELEQHGDRLLATHGFVTQVRLAARVGSLRSQGRWAVPCVLGIAWAAGSGYHGKVKVIPRATAFIWLLAIAVLMM